MFDTLAEYQWQTIQGTEWIDLKNDGQFANVNTHSLVVNNLTAANDGQLFRYV